MSIKRRVFSSAIAGVLIGLGVFCGYRAFADVSADMLNHCAKGTRKYHQFFKYMQTWRDYKMITSPPNIVYYQYLSKSQLITPPSE